MQLRKMAISMLDSIIDFENAAKHEAVVKSINRYISDNLKPEILDNSNYGIENRIEDSFEETCNSIQMEFPGVNLRVLSVYDFMSKLRFIKKKYEEINKKRN